jgi:hypothetical protein
VVLKGKHSNDFINVLKKQLSLAATLLSEKPKIHLHGLLLRRKLLYGFGPPTGTAGLLLAQFFLRLKRRFLGWFNGQTMSESESGFNRVVPFSVFQFLTKHVDGNKKVMGCCCLCPELCRLP